jgi:hypothetical protein
MKKFLFTFGIVLIQALACAQEEVRVWTLYKSVDGIEIYTQEIDCHALNIPAQKAVLVRVVNTNNYSCSVDWDLAVWYNNERLSSQVGDGENHHSTSLKPGEAIEGSCENPYGAFYIFRDFITYISPTKLTRFELENLRITRI